MPFADDKIRLPDAAVVALDRGQVIEAIKIVRERERLDLKDAKGRVDSYLAQHSELKRRLDEQVAEVKTTFRRSLLVIVVVTVAAALYWWFH